MRRTRRAVRPPARGSDQRPDPPVPHRRRFEAVVNSGALERIWQGIYCRGRPTRHSVTRPRLRLRQAVPVCLGTAAALHGFDTEEPADLHVLSPPGRDCALLTAGGAPPRRRTAGLIGERPATSPAWTAVEVARSLRRPRALATLDAALRSGTCNLPDLWRAAVEQAGRRGIVAVRDLIPLADGLAESPMESEARLAMIDGGLPGPTLQYELIDGTASCGELISPGPKSGWRQSTTASTGTATLTRCDAIAGATPRSRTFGGP